MRKKSIIPLIVVVVLVAGVLLIPSLVDVNHYHDRIQADLEKRFARQVSLGKMRLSVVPFRFRVENVVIGEDPHFNTGRAFAQAQELDVRPQLWPLLRGNVQIESLTMKRPQIELVRSQLGVWNFASVGQASSGNRELSLSQLSIENGQVAVSDLQNRQPRAVYDNIDAALNRYAPERAFDIKLAARLPGEGAQTIEIDARLGPIRHTDMAATPFDGKLRLGKVWFSSLRKFLNSAALGNTDALASGETRIQNDGAKIVASGSLSLDHARINGIDIGYAIQAQYEFSDDRKNEVLTIQKGSFQLGSTPMAISGIVNMGTTPSEVDVKLSTSNAPVEETTRLLAAFGIISNAGVKVNGRLSADVHAKGAASHPALNGSMQAQSLEIAGKELIEPVRVNNIQLTLSPQDIRSNNFSAASGSTRVDAQFAILGYTTPSPNIDLSVRTSDAKVGEVLNIVKAYGVSAVEGLTGTGALNLDMRASGPLKNAAAMNFSGSGQIRNTSLHLPQLTKPLEVHKGNIRFTQNSVVLEDLSATLEQINAIGTLTVRNFGAPQVQFNVSADKIHAADLEQMFSSGPVRRSSSANPAAGLIATVLAATTHDSMLSKATGSGKLTVGSVIYDQLALANVHSDVSLDHGIIRLAPLTAELEGGEQNGSVVIDTRPTPMIYTVSSQLKNVDANKLLSAVSSVKGLIFGILTANANTSFRAASSDQITRNLNGTLSLKLNHGRVAGFNLLQELATLGQFVNSDFPSLPFTDVIQLTGNFNVRDGIAYTDNLKAAIDAGSLAGAGSINLVDQSVDLRVTAVLSKEISERVGGNGIGGFMSTALANGQGELVIPVILTGTLRHPRFAPDVQTFAQMKLRNMVPSAQNPRALENILGELFRKPKTEPPSEPKPE
ncbi:MAG TPA: AsmA family protein [Candidatus Dormibacteraeota bacterium]|nr:AsmA family protein [Candidatus Dormibacteraeota bacterium]